ncbi:hypothetical protein Tb927.3.1640 [Trypanosoma brucei brucei TREU927]|uniref:Uncharacterized protein n=1 Tax=Trypanosoma brucei brucei (strain 927/4 GUTat10.1) TaxID=185431 RepID=Q57ZE7_TRYB2|nr:hypothetical protein Tb927.3.1640 [Trypanosoma brucei brucei TREU927]AAX80239.1 hypothetical protein Tb927.3.1640 [Trypanosoma brucei]AAZ10199.1 hypothetical protein Tb927.3.1640 [Trypanosoma brucei brucei TREU927]
MLLVWRNFPSFPSIIVSLCKKCVHCTFPSNSPLPELITQTLKSILFQRKRKREREKKKKKRKEKKQIQGKKKMYIVALVFFFSPPPHVFPLKYYVLDETFHDILFCLFACLSSFFFTLGLWSFFFVFYWFRRCFFITCFFSPSFPPSSQFSCAFFLFLLIVCF